MPKFEELISREGTVRVLMDMSEYKSEAPGAWKDDLRFGREFHKKIEKMAIVGDKRWENWMADFCAPFYARAARFFHTDDSVAVWEWLRS